MLKILRNGKIGDDFMRHVMKIKQYNINFSGEVQGVNFRDIARIYAKVIGITGTVENWSSGSVHCEAQGTSSLVDIFILALRKKRKVRGVEKVETELKNRETEFTIKY